MIGNKIISNRIQVILDLEGRTQTDLAEKIGMDRHKLNRIIKGQTVPGLDTTFRICRALGYPIERVFQFGEEAA